MIKDNEQQIKTLYHGSIAGIKGKPIIEYSDGIQDFEKEFSTKEIEDKQIVKYSDRFHDFGKGFYLAELEEQAINRVCKCDKPKIYKYDLVVNSSETYEFENITLWALYVARCRKMYDFSKYSKLMKLFDEIDKYSVMVGYIADEKIFEVHKNFINGSISDLALQGCLKSIRYGRQYVIKNQSYCGKYLYKISEYDLSEADKQKSQQWEREAKQDIKNKLETIKEQYRNNYNNRFFNEIIEEYR